MDYEDEEETFPYKTVGTDEAKRMIESGVHVIDVRTAGRMRIAAISRKRNLFPSTVSIPLAKHSRTLICLKTLT